MSNFDDNTLRCTLVLESAHDMTVVGKPAAGGHLQLFEPSPSGSVMVEGAATMDVSLPASGARAFNLGFCPFGTHAQAYGARLKLFLREELDADASALPYLDIQVVGVGSDAHVYFDRCEVVMPVVPVNVTARTTFYLLNHGFDNLFLKPHLPEGLGFTLRFPEGQVVSVAKKRLPVLVEFEANKPTSVAVRLSLVDPQVAAART